MSRRTGPPEPPRVARALLLALAPEAWRDQLDGDLTEGYRRTHAARGPWRARAWYWRQLLSADLLRMRRAGRSRQRRDGRPSGGPEGIVREVVQGVRTLRRSLGFTAAVLLTLALGIGANTAIFSVVNGVLLRGLPYPDPGQLAMVFRTAPRFGFARSTVSYPDYADWRAASRTFTDLAAYRYTAVTHLSDDGAERWTGYAVTANLLPLMGVEPAAGRLFRDEEDVPGAPRTVVLAHETWQSRFGGAPGIVGNAVSLDDELVTVVGVMPAGFRFPTDATSFWTPLQGDLARMERDSNFLSVIGRLAPGRDVAEAQGELEALAARIDEASADGNEGMGIFVEGRHAFEVRNAREALLIFFGAVGLVLVVACANVANLMLARGTTRRREMAVRASLGAGPGRITRQLLIESSLLGLAGGLLGLLLAEGLLRFLLSVAPARLPRLGEVGLDPVALGFTVAISLGAGLAFGTAPALLGRRVDLAEALKEGGSGTGIGPWGRRLQGSFVVAQVALAIILCIGAGLLGNSFARLMSVEPGFDPSGVVAARVTPRAEPMPMMAGGLDEDTMGASAMEAAGAKTRFFEDVRRDVQGLPGVDAVALAYGLPFGAESFSRTLVPEGMDVAEGEEPTVSGNVVDGEYFRAMGIPLLAGRAFSPEDGRDAPLVALVNQSMADRFWPRGSAVGRRMAIGGAGAPWTTVVGVVADVKLRALDEEPLPAYYRPLAQVSWPDGMFVLLRTVRPPSEMVAELRAVVTGLDRELPLTDVTTASELIERTVEEPRFNAMVLATFGILSILLALVGIYGVIAYSVAERTGEIGVRMALGAARGRIARAVFARGALLTAVGVALGIAGALALTRLLAHMLYGVTATDVPTYGGAALLLVVVSALGCLIPAYRASSVDPLRSLRND